MEFPDDLTELGTALADGDYVLVNKKKSLLSRFWTYVSAKITAQTNYVTDAMLRTSAARSIVGRASSSSGAVADITATGSSDAVLRESGGSIGFGTVATAGIANGAVTSAKLEATVAALVARLTAKRTVTGTTATLAITDKILAINASGNFTLTLPTAASAAGLDFLLQRIDIASAYTLTLALDAADAADGRVIYFQGNTPSAGANLTVTGADSQTRPGFLLWSDGTNWYLA